MDRKSELAIGDRGLRARAARGTIINGAFLAGINFLGLLKGVVAAGLLTAGEFGVWAILAVTLATLLGVKNAGIGDKYIQQNEGDQQAAFEKAFTLELVFSAVFVLIAALMIPVLVLLTGESDLLLPGLVLITALPAVALQSPIWVFYRRMQFARQRALQAIDPVVTLVVSVGLAATGFGYWGLVIGAVAGSWAAAVAALVAAPYRPAIRWDLRVAREYLGFSWPLVLAATSTIILGQGTLLIGEATLGLAGAGAIYLAVSIALYANKLDEVLTQTLYPAICAVTDRLDLLAETFFKSNRLALLWGLPFGVGVALFTPDLIDFGIGEKWRPAEALIQTVALIVAVNQIAFNWNAYFQALDRTWPIAVAAVATLVAMVLVAFPLLALNGLGGFALGLAIANAAAIAVRLRYVGELFPLRPLFANAAQACVPAAAAATAVGLARLLADGERTLGLSLGELSVFGLLVISITAWRERGLLGEIAGYMRAGRAEPLSR